MSLASNVIIPIVKNSFNLQQLNAFIPLSSSPSFQKQENAQDTIIWKKSISAFRRFREKRQVTTLQKDTPSHHYAQQCQQIPKTYIKLAKRSNKNNRFHSQFKVLEWLKCSYDYFDPNTAPLYEYSLNQVIDLNEKTCRQSWSTKQMEGQYQQIKNEAIQLEVVEEYIPIEVVMEYKEDDPFLIIRRQNISKVPKVIKTKYIKKDSTQRGKQKNMRIFDQAQKDQRRKEFSLNWNNKISAATNMESQSLRCFQIGNNQYGIKVKKQIQTLQKILKYSKQNYEVQKLHREGDAIILHQSVKNQHFEIIQ